MSKDFQSISIIGSVGKDPESRAFPDGGKIVSFSVAVESGFGKYAYTEWFNISATKDQASFSEQYIKKGKRVAITGKLKTRSWDDKQTGQKRYRTELMADSVDFFGDGGSKTEGRSSAPRTATGQTLRETPAPIARAAAPDPFAGDAADDDIPF